MNVHDFTPHPPCHNAPQTHTHAAHAVAPRRVADRVFKVGVITPFGDKLGMFVPLAVLTHGHTVKHALPETMQAYVSLLAAYMKVSAPLHIHGWALKVDDRCQLPFWPELPSGCELCTADFLGFLGFLFSCSGVYRHVLPS